MADNEWRIFGPPGTGKTTYLARQIERAAERFGSKEVLVTSYTRAAAVEMASRKTPIDRSQIGTLHAHCYRSMGSPQIAETHLAEWNAFCAGTSEVKWTMTPGQEPSIEEWKEHEGKANGDAALQHANRLRAQMIDQSLWPAELQHFFQIWTAWKKENDLVDFTDMVEIAYHEIEQAPGDPKVSFADEVQDYSKLELAVLRKWSEHTEFTLIAGDDDQAIYQFRGCSADAFLDPPVDDAHKRILAQSYRVPRAILDYSQDWIRMLTRREPKLYKPREDQDGQEVMGAIRKLRATRFNPKAIIQDMEQYLAQGLDIMVIASCSYMIDGLKEELRAMGIPFHNPYRRRRGDWNPLRQGDGKSVPTHERVLAFLRPQPSVYGNDARSWSVEDLKRWTDIVKSKDVLNHGAKKRIGELKHIGAVPEIVLAELFQAEALRAAQAGDTRWLQAHTTDAKKSALEFPLRVIRRRGPAALKERPQVVLGTIHSVKGAEAQVVYLMPDLSPMGMLEWNNGLEHRDAIIRQMYVGMTRARDVLVMLNADGNNYVQFPEIKNEGNVGKVEAKATEREHITIDDEVDEEL